MLADVSSQFVVLFVLEGFLTFSDWLLAFSDWLQQVFDDGPIIKETVNVGANTMIILQDGLIGIADTLMNLVTLTRLTIKIERHLTRGLLGCHRCIDGQES